MKLKSKYIRQLNKKIHMKRILLLVTILFFASFKGYSQCTPDNHTTPPYIRPDGATGLPHATVGVPYSAVMQVRVPHDTIVSGSQWDYDYTDITSVTGLPPGYTYACNPSNCHFLGASNNCVLISGPAPTSNMAGDTFHLSVSVSYQLHLDGFPFITQQGAQNVDYYMIIVDPLTGIATLSSSKFDVAQNRPNPFNGPTVIEFSTPTFGIFTLKISDILGKTVSVKNITGNRGINRITLSAKDFQAGIYFYTLSNNNTAITKRMIIQNE